MLKIQVCSDFGAGHGRRRARKHVVIHQLHQTAQQDKAQAAIKKVPPRKQNAGDDDGQQIERDEVALVPAGDVDQTR